MNIAQYDPNNRDTNHHQWKVVSASSGTSTIYQYPERMPGGMPPQAAELQGGHLSKYLRTIWRRKGLILLAAVVAGGAGFGAARMMKPVHRSQALLEVRSVNVEYLNRGAIDPTAARDGFAEDSFIQTQKWLLKSDALLTRSLEQQGTAEGAEEGLPWSSGENLTFDAKLQRLGDKINVQSTGFTKLVEVAFESPNPQYAAGFVNALCDQFIQMNIEARRAAMEQTVAELSTQLGGLREKLLGAEDELSKYAKSRNIFITEGNENIDHTRLKQLQTQLSGAQEARVEKQAQFEQASAAAPESLPSVLDDASIKETRSKIAELRQRVAELSITLTPAHHKTQALQAQLTELEGTYERQRENILRRLRNEFEAAKRREDLLSQHFAAQSNVVSDKSAKALRYDALKREVEVSRSLYESMLQKAKEAQVLSAMQSSNIRVVDRARVPSAPVKPKPVQNAVLAAFAGLTLSSMLVLLFGSSKTHFVEPGEAGEILGVLELGAIPRNSLQPASSARNGQSLSLTAGRDIAKNDPAVSLYAESFRTVVATILGRQSANKPFSLVITSPSVGDGKTSTVANLGMVLASTGRKTLLIDGDMRKPTLHSQLRARYDAGLSQVLAAGKTDDLKQFIQETDIPNLHLIASGGPHSDVAPLLLTPVLGTILAQLRNDYEVILIDSPPVLHLADARAFARHTDGVVLIVRSSKAKRHVAVDARNLLEADAGKFFGVVLNDWDPRGSEKADSYYAYHHTYFAGDRG